MAPGQPLHDNTGARLALHIMQSQTAAGLLSEGSAYAFLQESISPLHDSHNLHDALLGMLINRIKFCSKHGTCRHASLNEVADGLDGPEAAT